jgi:hypothetical protein
MNIYIYIYYNCFVSSNSCTKACYSFSYEAYLGHWVQFYSLTFNQLQTFPPCNSSLSHGHLPPFSFDNFVI